MSLKTTTATLVLTLFLAGLPFSHNSYAQPPDSAQQGQGKGKNKDHKDDNRQDAKRQGNRNSGDKKPRNPERSDLAISLNFSASQRDSVRDYYNHMYRQGKCPPGLAKKNNGCQPPGQTKKWRKGFPLDAGITFYDIDSGLLARLGKPPSGYKYVRVASDILMLAVGTNLVVDAIENLGNY